MAALDDAIDNPTVVYVPPKLQITWSGFAGVELEDASQMVGSQFTATHEMFDGLPDPVTATPSSNGFGTLELPDLLGLPPRRVATVGFRQIMTQINAGDVYLDHYQLQTPLDLKLGDFLLAFFSFRGSFASMESTIEGMLGDWELKNLTGWTSDGTLHSAIFGGYVTSPVMEDGYYYLNSGFTAPIAASLVIIALYGQTMDGYSVPIRLAQAAGVGETATLVANHTAPPVTLTRRGVVVSSWARAGTGATWTPPAGDTELVELASGGTSGNDAILAVSASPVVAPGTYTKVGVTHSNSSTCVMSSVALEFLEHDGLDARQYFSPFNQVSPIVNEPRDTAPVTLDFGVLTNAGSEYTRIYTGQMADIKVKGREAEMSVVSATRLDLMKSVLPPAIWGQREGLNATFLLSWVTQECNLFVSPQPTEDTRSWIPCHGSLHDVLSTSGTFRTYEYDYRGMNSLYRPVYSFDGPFLGSIHAEQTLEHAVEHEWKLSPKRGMHKVYGPDYWDQSDNLLSSSNSKARLGMWVKCDPWEINPPGYTVSSGREQIDYYMRISDATGTYAGLSRAYVRVGVRHSNRQLFITLGSAVVTTQEFTAQPGVALPNDGEWHFITWAWEWKEGRWLFAIDGVETTGTALAIDDFGPLNVSLPSGVIGTDELYYVVQGGNYLECTLASRMTVAEIKLEAGFWVLDDPEYDQPMGVGFVPDVIARPVDLELEVLAYPTALEAWQIIQDLARATLSAVRINETDQLMFMPLSYFGESEQMAVEEIVDTEVNAQDLDIRYDPTKIRNYVTVEFPETRVDSTPSHVLKYSTVEEIPPGVTTRTYTLDVPMVQLYEVTNIWGKQDIDFTNGNFPATESFATFSANAEGTGTRYGSYNGVIALFLHDLTTATTVTIRYVNLTGAKKYLTNNGSEIPYLAVSGYAIREATGYQSRTDPTSITTRRERALSSQIPIVQRRADAIQVASRLVNMLRQPRPEVGVVVMGDPRRKPGQLVTIKDSQGTMAAGNWRILTITHDRNNAEYRQQLHLVAQGDPALWDEDPGWDLGVWGE